ncbi:hypothetical protein V1512DRAFT_249969 [Lipomyces arxii]|uniref:uncharacterized protein n=1 Tax=Lipomyces arxii TaxID=56418 RepID=UPI0034CE421C
MKFLSLRPVPTDIGSKTEKRAPILKIDSTVANRFYNINSLADESPNSARSLDSEFSNCSSSNSNKFKIMNHRSHKNMDYAFPPFPTSNGPVVPNVYELAGFGDCHSTDDLGSKQSKWADKSRRRLPLKNEELQQYLRPKRNAPKALTISRRYSSSNERRQFETAGKQQELQKSIDGQNPGCEAGSGAPIAEPGTVDIDSSISSSTRSSSKASMSSKNSNVRTSQSSSSDADSESKDWDKLDHASRILSLMQARIGKQVPSEDPQPDLLQSLVSNSPSTSGCRACGCKITGRSVRCADGRIEGKWHKNCFKCASCGSLFPSGEFYVHSGQPYCEQHYHELNMSICVSCGKGIEGSCVELECGRRTHSACFRCWECGVNLVEDYYEIDDRWVCEVHATQTFNKQQAQNFAQSYV